MVLLNYLPVWSFMEITLVTAIVKIPRHMYPLVMLLFLSEYKFSTADNKSCVNQSIVFIYIKLFNSCLYIILSI